MKTSEKIECAKELCESLEYAIGRNYNSVYEWAENYRYRFDREKFDGYKESDENLDYHNDILDDYKTYCEKREFKQTIIDILLSKIIDLI